MGAGSSKPETSEGSRHVFSRYACLRLFDELSVYLNFSFWVGVQWCSMRNGSSQLEEIRNGKVRNMNDESDVQHCTI